MFKKYHPSADILLASIEQYRKGDMKAAMALFDKAAMSKDMMAVASILEKANLVHYRSAILEMAAKKKKAAAKKKKAKASSELAEDFADDGADLSEEELDTMLNAEFDDMDEGDELAADEDLELDAADEDEVEESSDDEDEDDTEEAAPAVASARTRRVQRALANLQSLDKAAKLTKKA